MDTCNGYVHYWSDDSYSQGTYPCPGPGKCLDTKIKPPLAPALNPPTPRLPAWDDLPRK